MENQKENIVIKFEIDKDKNEANALAVASAMEAIATMIEEVHQGFKDNHKLLVKARPFNPGSFEIPLDLIVIAAVSTSFFDKDIISGVLNIIKEYFNIKNLLKGETPKIENGKVIIKDNVINANNITITLLTPSSPANQLVSKAIKNANCDDSIKDMQIIRDSNKDEIAHVEKSQFGYYEIIQATIELPEEKAKKVKETLVIYGPILDANSQMLWHFIRDGKSIRANITDNDFLSKVGIGEQFAAGDTLEVDLLIRQKYNQMLDTYIDSKKTITKVHKHTEKQNQMEIDFDSCE